MAKKAKKIRGVKKLKMSNLTPHDFHLFPRKCFFKCVSDIDPDGIENTAVGR